MAHKIDINVRGYHLDFFGHVNNARYMEFLEEGRWAVFDDNQGIEELFKRGFVFTVVNININYRRPAFLHDILTIETDLKTMGSNSATLHQIVKNKKNGETIADADVTFVMLNVHKQQAAPLAGDLKEWLLDSLKK